MAASLLHPTPHFLPKPPSFSTLPSPRPSSSSKCIPIARSATRTARTLHVSSTDWPFEQRMQEALHVLDLMETQGMSPDPSLFCILLRSCADVEDIEVGKMIHQRILESKLQNDVFVANNLIKMYAKCGCLETARQLFDEMPQRNIVSWTSIISVYSQSGFPDEALRLYGMMKSAGEIKPNAFTYTIALNSCAKTGNLKMGVEIHEDILRDGCESDGFVSTALIDMYAKCGRIDDAHDVFYKMSEPSVASFTAMIEGYNANNRSKEAMDLIRKILQLDMGMEIAKELGFSSMIRSCILEMALKQGQEIHAHMIKSGYKPGARTISALIVLYEKCDRMAIARHLFDGLLGKDVSLWGRMILGYVRNWLHQEALELYCEMVTVDVEPSPFVLSQVLKACMAILGLEEGKVIHGRMIKAGYGLSDSSMIASLMKLYSRCGELEEANRMKKC
ncbi:pentatricopeptide repeat-containing protein At3g12770-like [Magnolia sinica]|uniref:pentatricopeptide repeat-containing protein At3g12770-like n=1 Tax=Magnolia sinica TaxID=86752 RepID=UPI002658F8DB|nr:pentatricopeptide repeat-containing protein At3g12770-like [Magnolia sinica]